MPEKPGGVSEKNDKLYSSTAKRLQAYELFSEANIDRVATFAQKQATYIDYRAFFKDMGIPKPQLFVAQNGAGVPVVDVNPAAQKGVIVLHLPMANPLDENQLFHIATVVGTNPLFRVIAFGNPSGKPYSYKQQNLSFWQKLKIAFSSKPRGLVTAELEYLKMQKIRQAHHVGYSYGAHKAMIEVYYSAIEAVASLTLIDPVAHPRGFKQLIHDFSATFEPLGDYVNRTQIPAYLQAREAAARTRHHDGALRRPINIAIGVLMRRLDLFTMLDKVLATHPNIRLTVAWGSKSELTNDAHMKVSMHRLKYEENKNVRALRLSADKHALANDIHAYAAIIGEGIRS